MDTSIFGFSIVLPELLLSEKFFEFVLVVSILELLVFYPLASKNKSFKGNKKEKIIANDNAYLILINSIHFLDCYTGKLSISKTSDIHIIHNKESKFYLVLSIFIVVQQGT